MVVGGVVGVVGGGGGGLGATRVAGREEGRVGARGGKPRERNHAPLKSFKRAVVVCG